MKRDIIFIAVFDGCLWNKHFVPLQRIAQIAVRSHAHVIDALNGIVALLKNLVDFSRRIQISFCAAPARRSRIVGITQGQMQGIPHLKFVSPGKAARHQTDPAALSIIFLRKKRPFRKVSLFRIKGHD